nr:leukotriene B4 receptor 1-like [Nothobranchius furzeri]
MSTSSNPSPIESLEALDGGTTAACVILGLCFLVGMPGNLLVIWTILRHIKQRLNTVVLILHLAAADLTILITLPLWIYALVNSWVFGEIVCKMLVYVIHVCMFSSIFLITLMSVERYIAICHPFVMMRWKTKRNMSTCLLFLWLLALILGVPVLITKPFDENDEEEQCFSLSFTSEKQAIFFLVSQTFLGFVLPLFTLSVCYCLVAAQLRRMKFNSKQKSKVLIYTVVIVFTLLWLPYHVVNIIDVILVHFSDTDGEFLPESVVLSTGALVFISSTVNPVLYVYFARNFKRSLKESGFVRLFQEVASHTNRLWEFAMQQEKEQGAASAQTEMLSSTQTEAVVSF